MARKKTLSGEPKTVASLLGQQTVAEQTVASLMDVSSTADGERRLRDALTQIADVASAAVGRYRDRDERDEHKDDYRLSVTCACCIPKSLPGRLLLKAAASAIKLNPVNAPAFWRSSATKMGVEAEPMFIAALTSKYWGPSPRELTVSFMESTPSDLRRRIVSHLNAWTKTGCISFVETNGTGDVRISREGGGYWSYLGTDIRHIPTHLPTMNLEAFTMSTPESEYKRVVRHEAGHTLGFPHEHMRKDLVARINPEKAYAYCLANFGWNKTTVDQQVLTSLNETSLLRTPPDQTSIMCYQLPGSITWDGQPIIGGNDINQTDFEFVALIYPKPGKAMPEHSNEDEFSQDWPESEDVEVVDV